MNKVQSSYQALLKFTEGKRDGQPMTIRRLRKRATSELVHIAEEMVEKEGLPTLVAARRVGIPLRYLSRTMEAKLAQPIKL